MQNKRNGKKMIVKLIIWGILALIIAGIMILMGISSKNADDGAEIPPEQSLPVTVSQIQLQTIDNKTVLPGQLDALFDITVPIENPGTVTEILVAKGDSVTNGQILLKVDARIWQDRLKQAEIDLRESAKDLERWQEMHKSGAVSKDAFDDYKTRSESAEIAKHNALINLQKCVVTSPIDGYVNNIFPEIGEYVNEGAPVFQILQLDKMKLIINIPERNITALNVGAPLPFSIKALPGKEFTATTRFISAQATAGNNSFSAEAIVNNPEMLLKAGMIAQVILTAGEIEGAIVIPLASIVPDGGDHVVYVVDSGNRARRSVVTIDAINGSSAIIGSGLNAGEELVIEGHRSLTDGVLIEIIQPSAE